MMMSISELTMTGSFGALKALPRQRELFDPEFDFKIEPGKKHPYHDIVSYRCWFRGEYAGHISAMNGKFRANVDLGYILYSLTAYSTYSNHLGEFGCLHSAACALEEASRTARDNPPHPYIWSIATTKAHIKIAKANGWWRKVA